MNSSTPDAHERALFWFTVIATIQLGFLAHVESQGIDVPSQAMSLVLAVLGAVSLARGALLIKRLQDGEFILPMLICLSGGGLLLVISYLNFI